MGYYIVAFVFFVFRLCRYLYGIWQNLYYSDYIKFRSHYVDMKLKKYISIYLVFLAASCIFSYSFTRILILQRNQLNISTPLKSNIDQLNSISPIHHNLQPLDVFNSSASASSLSKTLSAPSSLSKALYAPSSSSSLSSLSLSSSASSSPSSVSESSSSPSPSEAAASSLFDPHQEKRASSSVSASSSSAPPSLASSASSSSESTA
ncbi:hypothetical protein DICPUDRAFT_157273 [Dictyostelium purpureum]|uniref:Uncharacterized protein n=1 Tax=Dictyostelium purpureum TaxID=5786 RepID=F0ZYP9_DICPU|nr:uncharacterized protein DICPUDRAFT_157273 [Dictyostelium purpureum]EGC30940.1 hypothetical protein DICPUDRAFT_157273 [Dictyostelium purpureum]|eukprot:XP_003292543.1 hypothetical protein DICPUDRAFT_157273 [Dictyostelium purpureum]